MLRVGLQCVAIVNPGTKSLLFGENAYVILKYSVDR